MRTSSPVFQLGLASAAAFSLATSTVNASQHGSSSADALNAEGMSLLIPAYISAEGDAVFYNEALYHRDYSAIQHALASAGRVMRSSEMGHEAYQPDLSDDPMRVQGEQWLQVMQAANRFLSPEGFAGTKVASEGQWQPGRDIRLNELAQAAFSYHMHHSGGRWGSDALYQQITYSPTAYLAGIPRYLNKTHYRDGAFHNRDGEVTQATMAYGLDVLHSLSYAWVRWHKPGGSDDMGQLTEERMAGAHGISKDGLVVKARALADTLNDAWNSDMSSYNFGKGSQFSLDEFGSLVRGHKGLYEILYVFGNDQDKQTAEQLFNRNADMLLAVLNSETVLQPWGMVSEFRFTENGVKAASDRVETESQWRFVNHLTGGFGPLRERDGTSSFLKTRPELPEAVGRVNDQLFQAALEYQHAEDLMVRQLDFNTGEVTDQRKQLASIAWYVTAAGNGYRSGDRFDRPGSWEGNAELEQRSRALYDSLLTNNNWLLQQL
ncbi:hypothetical protein [Marinobacter sp.]|uniref:hypothetical protein n=1 Tax=Marinobacter sp. TaxID=50741 RepID=UPI001A0DF05E|nr:hypothetical protein [Marinobacter sp.]MBE0487343.1 hypothetical protein [Marinobacter sp.]